MARKSLIEEARSLVQNFRNKTASVSPMTRAIAKTTTSFTPLGGAFNVARTAAPAVRMARPVVSRAISQPKQTFRNVASFAARQPIQTINPAMSVSFQTPKIGRSIYGRLPQNITRPITQTIQRDLSTMDRLRARGLTPISLADQTGLEMAFPNIAQKITSGAESVASRINPRLAPIGRGIGQFASAMVTVPEEQKVIARKLKAGVPLTNQELNIAKESELQTIVGQLEGMQAIKRGARPLAGATLDAARRGVRELSLTDAIPGTRGLSEISGKRVDEITRELPVLIQKAQNNFMSGGKIDLKSQGRIRRIANEVLGPRAVKDIEKNANKGEVFESLIENVQSVIGGSRRPDLIPSSQFGGIQLGPRPKTDPIESLKQEAKKYKSAEEFIKAQPKVFHGSDTKIEKFDLNKAGANTDSGMFGKGIYFSGSRAEASTYARNTGNVSEYTLDLKNPFIIKSQSDIPQIKASSTKDYSEKFTKYLQDKGYDGVIDEISPNKQYVVFNPDQIKTKQQLTDIFNQAQGKQEPILNMFGQPIPEQARARLSKEGGFIQLGPDVNSKEAIARKSEEMSKILNESQTVDEARFNLDNIVDDIRSRGDQQDFQALKRSLKEYKKLLVTGPGLPRNPEYNPILNRVEDLLATDIKGFKVLGVDETQIPKKRVVDIETYSKAEQDMKKAIEMNIQNPGSRNKYIQDLQEWLDTRIPDVSQKPTPVKQNGFVKFEVPKKLSVKKSLADGQEVLNEIADDFIKAREVRSKKPFRDFKTKIKANFLDRFAAAEELDRDFFINLRNVAGGGSARSEQIVREGLEPILGDLGKNKNAFSQLLTLQRLDELVNERGFTRKGFTPEKIAAGLEELKNTLGEEQFNILNQKAGQTRQFLDNILNLAVDSGLISKEAADASRANNKAYITFETLGQLSEKIGEGGGISSKSFDSARQNVLKQIGSAKTGVADPLETTLVKALKTVEQADKNSVVRDFVTRRPDLVKIVKEGTLPGEGKGIISFMENGKKVNAIVPKELEIAVKNLDREQANWVVKILSIPTKALKAGAVTFNPAFLAVNPIRDIQDALISKTTKDGYKGAARLMSNYTSAAADSIGMGETWAAWRKAGGASSTFLAEEIMDKPELTVGTLTSASSGKGKKFMATVSDPRKIFDFLSRSGEETTRLAGFKSDIGDKAIQQTSGITPYAQLPKELREAAFQSRELTLDFSKMGSSVRTLNQLIPFFNVGIQGSNKLVNMMKNNPAGFAKSMAAYVAVPATLLYLHNKKFDDFNNDLQDYEKEGNVVFMLRDRTPEEKANDEPIKAVKIAMGNISKPFYNVFNNFLEFANKENPQSLQELARNLGETTLSSLEDMSPVGLPVGADRARRSLSKVTPQAIKPAIEKFANKNLFTGRQIEPDYFHGVQRNLVPKEERATNRTGLIARKLGPLTGKIGVSPAELENMVGTAFGGLGKDLLALPETISGGFQPEELPVSRRFLGASGGKETSQIYDQSRAIREDIDKETFNRNKAADEFAVKFTQVKTREEGLNLISEYEQRGLLEDEKFQERVMNQIDKQKKPQTKRVKAVLSAGTSNTAKAKSIVTALKGSKNREEALQLITELDQAGVFTKNMQEEILKQLQSGNVETISNK